MLICINNNYDDGDFDMKTFQKASVCALAGLFGHWLPEDLPDDGDDDDDDDGEGDGDDDDGDDDDVVL